MPADPRQIQELFLRLAELPPGDRAAALERECGSDAELRRRLAALLQAHAEPDSFLDQPPGNPPANNLAATLDSGVAGGQENNLDATLDSGATGVDSALTGEHTPNPERALEDNAPRKAAVTHHRRDVAAGVVIGGRYTLREKIGEGGMGEVWVAKQTEPVKRKVALKLIKAGMDSRAVLQRFEQERQALAMMDHPSIAGVLDGGMTPTGQPFFVMELVNGLPLTQFCDQAKLTPKERLELFVPICQAVQHAHQKGIVHRDLKPANILVTLVDGRPSPKVIDFGVAKATSGKLTEETMSTGFGAVVGTFEYMSPEQAGYSNDDIDTRADIYSLGVILYELLTGLRPIDAGRLKQAALTEMIRIIHEEEPSKPSTRLSTDEALPSLAAVRQMEPKKLMALLRGELDWVVMKCLEKSRDRRYETANALSRDIQRYLANEPVEARPPSAAYRARKFLRRHRGPIVAATLLLLAMVAGIVGTAIGMFRAEAALELAVAAQRAEAKRAEGERQAKIEAQEATTQARKRLSQIETANRILGSIFESINPFDYDDVDRPLREVLLEKLDRAVEQLDGEAIGDPLVVASMQGKLALSLAGLGAPAKAKALLEKVIRTHEELLGPEDPTTLISIGKIATLLQQQGQQQEALELHSYVLKRQQLGDDDLATMLTLSHIAEAHHQLGRPDLAVPLLEKVLEFRESQFGENHPDVLSTMNDLAAAYEAVGELQLALPLFERSLEQFKLQLGDTHLETIRATNNLAFAYLQDGRPELAAPMLEEALELARSNLGNDHPAALTALHNLAGAYKDLQELDRALPLFEESLELTRAKRGDDHPDTLSSMNGLAACYQRTGKPESALPIFQQLLVLMKKVYGDDHPHTASVAGNLAVVYESLGEKEKALDLFEEVLRRPAFASSRLRGRVLQLCVQTKRAERAAVLGKDLADDARRAHPDDSPVLADKLGEIGGALLQAGAYSDAASCLRESLAILQEVRPDVWSTFHTQSRLGGALLGQQNYAEAEPLLLIAYEGLKQRAEQIPQQSKSSLAEALERLIALYTATEKQDEVLKWQVERD